MQSNASYAVVQAPSASSKLPCAVRRCGHVPTQAAALYHVATQNGARIAST
jgi:hypothetical protein